MLFDGKPRPEIIDYARRRLGGGLNQASVTKKLMEKWPNEVRGLTIAHSVITFAKQALRS